MHARRIASVSLALFALLASYGVIRSDVTQEQIEGVTDAQLLEYAGDSRRFGLSLDERALVIAEYGKRQGWDALVTDRIRSARIEPGYTRNQVICAWGFPTKTETSESDGAAHEDMYFRPDPRWGWTNRKRWVSLVDNKVQSVR